MVMHGRVCLVRCHRSATRDGGWARRSVTLGSQSSPRGDGRPGGHPGRDRTLRWVRAWWQRKAWRVWAGWEREAGQCRCKFLSSWRFARCHVPVIRGGCRGCRVLAWPRHADGGTRPFFRGRGRPRQRGARPGIRPALKSPQWHQWQSKCAPHRRPSHQVRVS